MNFLTFLLLIIGGVMIAWGALQIGILKKSTETNA